MRSLLVAVALALLAACAFANGGDAPHDPPSRRAVDSLQCGSCEPQQTCTCNCDSGHKDGDSHWPPVLKVPIVIKRPCPPCDCDKKGEHERKQPHDPPRITDWLLAGFTLGLVLVGTAQVRVMRATTATTRALERPWLLIGPAEMFDGWQWEWTLPEGSLLRLQLPWSLKNEGRSVAWVTKLRIGFHVVPVPFPKDPPYDENSEEIVSFALAPHGQHGLNRLLLIDAIEHSAILRGDARLVFVADVSYRDTFGDQHRTRMAYEWRAPRFTLGDKRGFLYGPSSPPSWIEYT